MKKITENEDGTIMIPLNQKYPVLIAKKEDHSEFKMAIEEMIPEILDETSYLITEVRHEELGMTLTRDQIISGLDNGIQYLVWHKDGIQKYQLLKKESLYK